MGLFVAPSDRFIVQLCGLQHNLPNVISKLWTWTALAESGARFQFNASFNWGKLKAETEKRPDMN